MFGLSRKTIATILAAVMYGVGHIYLGSARRGIAILCIGIGLSLISIPGYFAADYAMGSDLEFNNTTSIVLVMAAAGLVCLGFWVWQIFDARKLAKQQIEV